MIGHPETQRLLSAGDRIWTYAEISAQKISIDLPTVTLDEQTTSIARFDRAPPGDVVIRSIRSTPTSLAKQA